MVQTTDEIYQNEFVKLKICVGTIFFCLGEGCQNWLATISICKCLHISSIAPTLPNVHGWNEWYQQTTPVASF